VESGSSTAAFTVAVGLGLAFIGIVQLGVRYAELVTGRYVTGGVPPIPAFGALIALVGLRPLLRRTLRVELSREQLLIVYSMVALGTFISGAYGIRAFLPHTVALQYWSGTKRALAPFVQYLPVWFAPADEAAIRDYFQGNYGRGGVPWALWLRPLAIWLTLWVALFVAAWCLMLLFRRQWIQHERLSFPLLTLPLALTSEGEASRFGHRPLFRNPVLWLGLAVPALADGLNILHALYPNIPAPSTGFAFSGLFPDPPLTPLNSIRLGFLWEAIGFGYFVPLDISFSAWFFFVAEKLSAITALASGYDAPGMPFLQEQSAGAYLVVGALLLLGARRHLAHLGRRAFLQPWRRAAEEDREARVAALGLVACAAYLLWFIVHAGLPLRIALPYGALLACFMLVYARIRAETGVPFEFIYPYSLPKEMLIQTLPLLGVVQMGGPRSMTLFSAFAWLSRHHAASATAAYQIDALKLADVARVPRRRLFIALALAFLFAVVGACWSHLSAFYDIGSNLAAGGIGQGDTRARVAMQEYERMAQWVSSPPAPDILRLGFVAGGGVLTLALALLRNVWLGSPFHPLGFILATAYGDSGHFAFPLFVAWFLKWLLLRVGGLPLYRAALPFFIGLIVGHFSIAGVFWPLFSLIISPEASAAFHLAFG
jgi:hypothetical protein